MGNKIKQKEYIKNLEAFNANLIVYNCCLVLMDSDLNRPIGIIKPNILTGLCQSILDAIKDDKASDNLKVRIISAKENQHSCILELNVEIDDDGNIYEQEYECYSNCLYNTD